MKRWRILVVDDEPGVLRAVQRVLGSAHDLTLCDSSPAARDLARRSRPHLALIDIRMPHLDGFDLMTQLKEDDPDLEVILMTGSMDDTDEKLVRAVRNRAFYYITKPFDRDALLALVDRCLELKRLELSNRAYADHLRRQLLAAGAFQRTMLPPASAHLNGVELRAGYYPCDQVAGDYYDYAVTGGDLVTLLVADVVGHGASAAMFTALVKSAFHRAADRGYAPLRVARILLDDLSAFESDQYVTLLCARLSRSGRTIEYVNAGHSGGLIVGGDETLLPLEVTSPLISPVVPPSALRTATIPLPADSLLLLFTDGAAEAWSDDEMFGLEWLYALARTGWACRDALPQHLQDGVRRFLGDRSQTDDITFLAAWPASAR